MSLIDDAKSVFEIEARAISSLGQKLDKGFEQAVDALFECRGKVIVTGMGKSGQIGRKVASTLASTGTPAVFVHPAETSHGDMGILASGDVVIALSYRGETDEMRDLIRYAKRKGLLFILMTGHRDSSMARAADIVLDVSVEREACPLGLAPTASTTAALAMGDALAVVLLKRRGLNAEEFAEFHPGGSLGRKLLTRVRDLMHTGQGLPIVGSDASVKDVIAEMTRHEVRGVCGVVDSDGQLIGVITDGDLRRRLEKSRNPLEDRAVDIMGRAPKVIGADELAERALFMMEQFAIQNLFVIEAPSVSKPVGLLHLQDLLRARVQ